MIQVVSPLCTYLAMCRFRWTCMCNISFLSENIIPIFKRNSCLFFDPYNALNSVNWFSKFRLPTLDPHPSTLAVTLFFTASNQLRYVVGTFQTFIISKYNKKIYIFFYFNDLLIKSYMYMHVHVTEFMVNQAHDKGKLTSAYNPWTFYHWYFLKSYITSIKRNSHQHCNVLETCLVIDTGIIALQTYITGVFPFNCL